MQGLIRSDSSTPLWPRGWGKGLSTKTRNTKAFFMEGNDKERDGKI